MHIKENMYVQLGYYIVIDYHILIGPGESLLTRVIETFKIYARPTPEWGKVYICAVRSIIDNLG